MSSQSKQSADAETAEMIQSRNQPTRPAGSVRPTECFATIQSHRGSLMWWSSKIDDSMASIRPIQQQLTLVGGFL